MGSSEVQVLEAPSAQITAMAGAHRAPPAGSVRSLASSAGTRPNNGSRMRRESHVRFCESVGVKLPHATHLVILCRKGKADEALQQLREIMGRLKLTVNEEKTRICKVPEGEFDFLGYTFGRMFSERTGQARLGYRPSKKSIKRMVEKIHALTDRTGTWQETTKLVGKVNRTLRGWANYFQVGTVSKAYRALDSYAAMRLRRWLQFKHKTRRRKGGTYPLPHLYGHFGLVRLSRLGHDVPWVKA